MGKIIHLKDLEKKIKRNKSKIVLVGGCFDVLHIGHIYFLKQARKYGDLIVLLEPDEKIRRLKGIKRPIHTQQERAEILSVISCVDYVVLLPILKSDDEYTKLVKLIRPDIIATTENDPIKNKKSEQAKKVGAKLIEIKKIKGKSTSAMVEEM